MNKYSRENGYICEFDDYPIPKYDSTLSPEERAKRRAEAVAEFKAVMEEITGKKFEFPKEK